MAAKLTQSYRKVQTLESFFTSGSLKVDCDGQFLLCSTGDAIRIVSILDGKEKLSIQDKANPDDFIIDFVPGSQNGSRKVFVACRSGLIKEWDLGESEATIRRTWKSLHLGPISVLALSNDGFGDLLATGGSDSIVKIWNLSKQYCDHHLKGCRGVASYVTFSLEKEGTNYVIASGELDNSILIWSLDNFSLVSRLEGHSSRVVGVVLIEDEETKVLSGSRDMIAIIWSLKESTPLRKIPLFESVETISLLPKKALKKQFTHKPVGRVFLTGGPKGIIKAWDSETGNCVFQQKNSPLVNTEEKPLESIVQCFFLPKSKEICAVSFEKNIFFFCSSDLSLKKQLVGHIDQVYDVKFLGTEEDYLIVATNSANIKIFHQDSMNCRVVTGHSDMVLALQVYHTNPNLFASASKDNDVRVWEFLPDKMDVRCLYKATGHSLSVTSIAVPFKSSEWLFSASEDTTMKVWKIPSKIKSLDETKIEDLSTLETIKAHDKEINSIVLSLNDKYVCTCSQDRTAKLWSFERSLTLLHVFKGHRRGVWSSAFSPVDLILATSSADTTIKIWSLTDFACLKTLQGHDSSVLNIFFINQGVQLISSASDGNVKLWTVKKAISTLTLDAHSDKIWALALKKDEKFLVTGSEESRIIIWEDDTEEKRNEEAEKQEQDVVNEQKLENLIFAQKWSKALRLSIKLDQPFKTLAIIKEILLSNDNFQLQNLKTSLQGLREDHLCQLLQYALKWNTNTKNCEAAQSVFNILIEMLGFEKMLELPNSKTLIEGWLSYSRRHMSRANRMEEQAHMLNFLYSNMRLE